MSVKRALVLLPVIGVLLAATAVPASAAAPLSITKFTIEPTEPTIMRVGEPVVIANSSTNRTSRRSHRPGLIRGA